MKKVLLISFLSASFLLVLFSASEHRVFAQSFRQGKSAVTVKDASEFGERTVDLSEQRLDETHSFTMSATIKLRKLEDRIRDLGNADMRFTVTTGKREYGEEQRILVSVDGEESGTGFIESSPTNDNRVKDGKEIAFAVLSINALQKVAGGRVVKWKIGDKVFTLDQQLKTNIAEFVKALLYGKVR